MRLIGWLAAGGLLALFAACAQGERDTLGRNASGMEESQNQLPRSYRPSCATVQNPRVVTKLIGPEGDSIQYQGNLRHQLTVKPGVVPQGLSYLYVLTLASGPGNGCIVQVANVSGGGINNVSNPYRLRISCDNPGSSGNESCPDPVFIERLMPNPDSIGEEVETGARRWVEANLQTLSTYALAAPIVLGDE